MKLSQMIRIDIEDTKERIEMIEWRGDDLRVKQLRWELNDMKNRFKAVIENENRGVVQLF